MTQDARITPFNNDANDRYRLRDPISSFTHLISAVISLVGVTYLLIIHQDSWLKEISLVIYGFGLISLFLASGLYHAHTGSAKTILVLRKLDHAAIYFFIAATYTPFCLNLLSGTWRWGLLIVVWSMALVGIVVKMFIIQAPRWITAGVYLVMGWISVFAIREMLAVLTWSEISWLLFGGIFYTVGAIIYITRKMDFKPGVFGFHEVWHLFVMAAALCHFIFIAKIL